MSVKAVLRLHYFERRPDGGGPLLCVASLRSLIRNSVLFFPMSQRNPTKYQVEQANLKRVRERQASRLDPMLGRKDTGAVKVVGEFLRRGNIILPFALLFSVGSIGYVLYDNVSRRGNTVCVDCNRQKEIAEEIYGKKPMKPIAGTRMMP